MGHVRERIRELEARVGRSLEEFLGEQVAAGMSKSEFARVYLGLTLVQMAGALRDRARPKIGQNNKYPGKLQELARDRYGRNLDDLLRDWHAEGLLPPEMQERLPGASERQLQRHLKRLKLANTRPEARKKSIAKGRTRYAAFLPQVRKSLVRTMVLGSARENLFRDLLNAQLDVALPSEMEYTVGLQNRRILPGGREVDVPVLVFHRGQTYRFAIEFDGMRFHGDEEQQGRDREKTGELVRRGWSVIRIADSAGTDLHTLVDRASQQILAHLSTRP
ncbi:MAG: hypothetical protein ACOY93_15340 [Bacillota bacterium]